MSALDVTRLLDKHSTNALVLACPDYRHVRTLSPLLAWSWEQEKIYCLFLEKQYSP